MKQITEFVALVDIDIDALLLAKPAFFVLYVGVNGANKLAVTALRTVLAAGRMGKLVGQVGNAAVKQKLDMTWQLRKLLNHEILLAH
jgi:hypothetical protein